MKLGTGLRGEMENGRVSRVAEPGDYGYPYVEVSFPDERVERYSGEHKFVMGQSVFVLRRVLLVLGIPLWTTKGTLRPNILSSGSQHQVAYR